jgi:hypothetical protein
MVMHTLLSQLARCHSFDPTYNLPQLSHFPTPSPLIITRLYPKLLVTRETQSDTSLEGWQIALIIIVSHLPSIAHVVSSTNPASCRCRCAGRPDMACVSDLPPMVAEKVGGGAGDSRNEERGEIAY